MSSKEKATAARAGARSTGLNRHHGVPMKVEADDPTPVSMPTGARVPTPLHELIARLVREQVADQTHTEPETWDEANDFDLPEDDDNLLDLTPYTLREVTEEEPDAAQPLLAGEQPTPDPDPTEDQTAPQDAPESV